MNKNTDTERLTAYVSKDRRRGIKILCMTKGITFSEWVRRQIDKELGEGKE